MATAGLIGGFATGSGPNSSSKSVSHLIAFSNASRANTSKSDDQLSSIARCARCSASCGQNTGLPRRALSAVSVMRSANCCPLAPACFCSPQDRRQTCQPAPGWLNDRRLVSSRPSRHFWIASRFSRTSSAR
jgi:hypothetical protein